MVIIRQNGKAVSVPAEPGQALYPLLASLGFAVDAPCGGRHKCHKCLVTVIGQVSPPTDAERPFIEGTDKRLACFVTLQGGAEITLPDKREMRIATHDAAIDAAYDASAEDLGVAFDIGTTTCAAFLVSLKTKKTLAVTAAVNPQTAFGADVITRISYCTDHTDGLGTLQAAILSACNTMIDTLLIDACAPKSAVKRISVACNTVMAHLFHGLNPEGLASIPFTAESLFGDSRTAATLPLAVDTDVPVYTVPAIASYVGGDITAGLLHVNAIGSEELLLFVDIGTNGEIALGNKDGLICCATAAGPAFEGADITCGMPGIPGAIAHLSLEDGNIRIETIGNLPPKGLCGSGLIDALALLLELEIVDETGRLVDEDEVSGPYKSLLTKTDSGEAAVRIAEGVLLTAADIRKLQLAKAAISAGISAALQTAGKTEADINTFYIAGGFGSFMKIESAARIGLFPAALKDKVIVAGNTAASGACLCLAEDVALTCPDIAARCTYLELSASPAFMDAYIENMMF